MRKGASWKPVWCPQV